MDLNDELCDVCHLERHPMFLFDCNKNSHHVCSDKYITYVNINPPITIDNRVIPNKSCLICLKIPKDKLPLVKDYTESCFGCSVRNPIQLNTLHKVECPHQDLNGYAFYCSTCLKRCPVCVRPVCYMCQKLENDYGKIDYTETSIYICYHCSQLCDKCQYMVILGTKKICNQC